MRTFVAVEVSKEIHDSLGMIESSLKYAGADVKWVDPAMIHLTLKFLGEITDKKADDVKGALDAIASATAPFDLSIKDMGVFPTAGHPRVLWVGLDKGLRETVLLASGVDEVLSHIGFTKETRVFSPHLTIGRVRSPRNTPQLVEKISSVTANSKFFEVPAHRVSSLILFRSTLTPHGSVYTKLHESLFHP